MKFETAKLVTAKNTSMRSNLKYLKSLLEALTNSVL